MFKKAKMHICYLTIQDVAQVFVTVCFRPSILHVSSIPLAVAYIKD